MAARLVSQADCSDEDLGVTPYDLDQQVTKMMTTQRRAIGKAIGIITKTQQRNYRARIKSDPKYIKSHKHSALLQEWYNLGREAHRIKLHLELLNLKKNKEA